MPGNVEVKDLHKYAGTETFNGNDFQQGFAAGPSVDLIRHGDSGYDFELSYFQISGWNSDRTIDPDDPEEWMVTTVSRRLPANAIKKPGQAWTGIMPRSFIMRSSTSAGILVAE